MSELKVYVHPLKTNILGQTIVGQSYYLKSEVDKVISELKDKCQMHDFFWEGCGFKKLGSKNSIDVRDYCDALKRQNEDLLQKCRKANKELRHHKYRRCLAVARRCHSESLWWYSKGYGFEKYDKFWEKWEKRWLELAEKFKEVK